jgi:HSP20 family protein
MGVIDKVTDTVSALMPWKGERRERQQDLPPIGAEVLELRDDLDRWLNRFFEEPWGLPAASDFGWTPSANVHETDKELVVTAELPGIDQADIRLTVTPAQLVISGEKKEETERTPSGYHVFERRYGSFVRTMPLPPGLDVDKADARAKNGVLTIRIPKATGQTGTRRVQVKT